MSLSMPELPWYQTAVFYQVYPRSFSDGNGDGVGDLSGLIRKLDYLQDLGINAIWLSPHYPSPQVDCGYDIADYTGVDPAYGTLKDFMRFVDEAHRRELKVVTDLVLNHTSDQHSWFKESRSNRSNPKRDWYVWQSGREDGPPNNWLSAFGGSAWELDQATGEYYYHLFFKQQPDLNWRCPAVKDAMWAVARFWLDLGVDGFRLDAIDTLYEHPGLPDHPVNRTQSELRHYLLSASSDQRKEHGDQKQLFQYQVDQPGAIELMVELRSLVDEYDDRVLIGESDRVAFYGEGGSGLHMFFNFPLMNMGCLDPEQVRKNQEHRLSIIPLEGWPANTLGNHDRSRTIQAHSDGEHDLELALASLAMLLTLRGTPFLYYGEEIGMSDLYLDDLAQIRDRVSEWVHAAALERGQVPETALQFAVRNGRDRCRTPMQWSSAPNAGFSPPGVRTWLPVNPNASRGVNVAAQTDDPGSMLNNYRKLLRLRKRIPALQSGSYQPIHLTAIDYLAYLRYLGDERQSYIVIINFSDKHHLLSFLDAAPAALCLFSTHKSPDTIQSLAEMPLVPFEVFIGECVCT